MNPAQLNRFTHCETLLRCPVCAQPLHLQDASLLCPNRHCFDVAKQGYVNLWGSGKTFDTYSKGSFRSRQTILDKGYYAHILDALLSELSKTNANTLLDVGCGEGYFSRKIEEATSKHCVAFDISRDSVQLAARSDARKNVLWFVGDLSNLPLQNGSIDCILDIFAPANYEEFRRVAAPDALLLKVVPAENHLTEFRALVKDQLRRADYSNEDVVQHFTQNTQLLSRTRVTRTFAMPPEDIQTFADMTPLLFHTDRETLPLHTIESLTIDAELLVGRL